RNKHRTAVVLSASGQARLGQIEIALDAAQRFVVDHVLIAQTDNGLAFDVERFLLKTLILRRGDFAAAIDGIVRTKFQLFYTLVVFGAQTVQDVGSEIAIGREFVE